MPKLKTLRPSIAPQKPRLGYAEGDVRGYDKQRLSLSPARSWYKTARWQSIREAILVRDLFTCQMCGRLQMPSQLVCDHVEPHRNDPSLFWEGPFQTLCKSPCHDKHKQKLESHPTDLSHHWHSNA